VLLAHNYEMIFFDQEVKMVVQKVKIDFLTSLEILAGNRMVFLVK